VEEEDVIPIEDWDKYIVPELRKLNREEVAQSVALDIAAAEQIRLAVGVTVDVSVIAQMVQLERHRRG
jgi:hypothetical protein